MREMKDSGVEWIGEIPKEWEIKRLKAVLCERNESNSPLKTNFILSLTNNRGVIPYADKGDVGNKSKEDITGYKLAYPGDIVLNSMNVIIGSVALSDFYGCVSPVYYMLYPRNTNDSARFYNYLFQTNELQNKLKGYGNGIMEIRMRIQMSKLNTILLPIAPKKRQHFIADYLDTKCSKIDAIIAREQVVIEKLKEYKQILISEAVRHGIHGEKLQSSRYFWIDTIPRSWKVGQLKYFATIRSGITMGKKYPNNAKLVDIPYLRVANVQGEYVDLSDIATISVLPEEVKKYSLKANELLMTEGGDRDKLGRGCVWKGEINPCLHQNHVFAVSTDSSRLLVHFLDYVTTSNIARNYFEYTAKKTTNLASTNSTTILQFRIPIPPVAEQQEIVDYLDIRCAKINQSIKGCKIIIEKLTEYKKSLIYEVVTGKKEV